MAGAFSILNFVDWFDKFGNARDSLAVGILKNILSPLNRGRKALKTLGSSLLISLLFVSAACGGGTSTSESSDLNDRSSASSDETSSAPEDGTTNQNDDEETSSDLQAELPSRSSGGNGDGDSWTILIYIMGDTDLEAAALYDLLELQDAELGENTNVMAIVDRSDRTDEENGYSGGDVLELGNFSDTRLLVFTADGLNVAEAADGGPSFGELNLGDPSVLAEFIKLGLDQFPADKTALFLWDHGAGWPGMGPDETDGYDILTLGEMRDGIEVGLEAAGVEKFDIIGMDACLMASYEVAHAVSGLTDYLLASEELEPGHGWDYRSLSILSAQAEVEPLELGRAIADGFENQAKEYERASDITLSLLDMAHFDDFTDVFRDILVDASDEIGLIGAEVRNASTKVPAYGKMPNPENSSHHIDLGAFVAECYDWNPERLAQFEESLEKLVAYKIAGPKHQKSTGLSIFFPAESSYVEESLPYYRNLTQQTDVDFTQWSNFLDAYLTAGEQIQTASYPIIDQDSVVNDFDSETSEDIMISGFLEPGTYDNVAEVVMYYGVIDPADDTLYYIGEEYGAFDAETGEFGAVYDFSILSISDGEDEIYAYADLWWEYDEETNEELLFIDVPLTYVPPDEVDTDDPPHEVVLSLGVSFGEGEGEVFAEIFHQVDEYGQWSEATLNPDGYLNPLVQMWDEEAQDVYWVDSSEDTWLWADPAVLQYQFSALPSETNVMIDIEVLDFGGNSDWTSLNLSSP